MVHGMEDQIAQSLSLKKPIIFVGKEYDFLSLQSLVESVCNKNPINKKIGFVLLANNDTFSVKRKCDILNWVPIWKFGLESQEWKTDVDFNYKNQAHDSRKTNNGCELAIYCIHEGSVNIPLIKHTQEIDMLLKENETNKLPLIFYVTEAMWSHCSDVITLLKGKERLTVIKEIERVKEGSTDEKSSSALVAKEKTCTNTKGHSFMSGSYWLGLSVVALATYAVLFCYK